MQFVEAGQKVAAALISLAGVAVAVYGGEVLSTYAAGAGANAAAAGNVLRNTISLAKAGDVSASNINAASDLFANASVTLANRQLQQLALQYGVNFGTGVGVAASNYAIANTVGTGESASDLSFDIGMSGIGSMGGPFGGPVGANTAGFLHITEAGVNAFDWNVPAPQ